MRSVLLAALLTQAPVVSLPQRAGQWRDRLDSGLGPLLRLVLTDAPGGSLWLFACD